MSLRWLVMTTSIDKAKDMSAKRFRSLCSPPCQMVLVFLFVCGTPVAPYLHLITLN